MKKLIRYAAIILLIFCVTYLTKTLIAFIYATLAEVSHSIPLALFFAIITLILCGLVYKFMIRYGIGLRASSFKGAVPTLSEYKHLCLCLCVISALLCLGNDYFQNTPAYEDLLKAEQQTRKDIDGQYNDFLADSISDMIWSMSTAHKQRIVMSAKLHADIALFELETAKLEAKYSKEYIRTAPSEALEVADALAKRIQEETTALDSISNQETFSWILYLVTGLFLIAYVEICAREVYSAASQTE